MYRLISLHFLIAINFSVALPSIGWADESPLPTGPETNATAEKVAVDENLEAEKKPPKMQTLTLHEGRLRFRLPAAWKKVKPRNRLVEVELAIHPAKANPAKANNDAKPTDNRRNGQMTLMASGGTAETILRRWTGRFRLGQDADGKDVVKRDLIEMEQAVVHTLDISGTYFDEPKGPLRPKVEMPDTRLLGAIIEVKNAGRFFVKIYGPEKLIAEQAEAFREMLANLEVLEEPKEPVEEAIEQPAAEKAEEKETEGEVARTSDDS